ncbi:MAG: hypothetical protein GF349_00930 [Candidatus Magasanikbacteria bacterium]|nr:hypothetical protein [Candidatus Magasanikbacteria bacterium]
MKIKNLDTAFWRWFLSKEQWLVEKNILRQEERLWPSSMMTFSIGLGVTYWFFPDYIVVPAVIILSLGDPAARIIGVNLRSYRFPNGKTIAGFLGFVTVALCGALAFNGLCKIWPMYPDHHSMGEIFGAQIAGVFGGAGVEFAFKRMDNMLIGVASAIAMSLVLL